MKIYTKTGDLGQTSLIYGGRFAKSEDIFEVLGTLDELNALLGLMPSNQIATIQSCLFELGALLANQMAKSADFAIFGDYTSQLEDTIDDLEEKLPTLRNFILPGGSSKAAYFHLARAVCRRLERALVRLYKKRTIGRKYTFMYINRLSDLLFVLARTTNHKLRKKDIIWRK